MQNTSRKSREFSREELQRYSRQLRLSEVGLKGQTRLQNAKVLIVGLGGLGAPLALYLAASGVGTIGLVDDDEVDITNLHRQVLFGVSNLGEPKVDAACRRLKDLNPNTTVVLHKTRITARNATEIIRGYDIVADASDNFQTRYLISDACVLAGIPDVFGSVHKFEGQVTVLSTKGGPCYRCLYPVPPVPESIPNCDESGVIGVVPGLIGTMQANEVLKLLLGVGEPLICQLALLDTLMLSLRHIHVEQNAHCPVCGVSPTILALQADEQFCQSKEQPNTEVMIAKEAITVEEYSQMRTDAVDHLLLDVRESYEFEVSNIGGTLIPMNTIPQNLEKLPHDKAIVVMCRSGARSSNVVRYLRQSGFPNAVNLAGGIIAWSERIDKTLRTN